VANTASGSVTPDAPEKIAAILAECGIAANVVTPEARDLARSLRQAVDAAPDLLIVLAGDGTARAAAELCGPDGPLLAPLPGGTMNVLSHALYGRTSWPDALRLALDKGEARVIGGGEVAGHGFLCGAILGSPARLGAAREAVRARRVGLAVARARKAFRRAFTGRLRYSLDGGPREKAEALLLICPASSAVLDEDAQALEAAALNVQGAAEVLRLGVNALVRDWRIDPAVENRPCRVAHVWSAHGIPALLDGEWVRLPNLAEVRYQPRVVRVLAPPKEDRA
jgi:diacylglycerol kinase family enzyme